MKNSTTSKKNTPSTKKGTATPQKEGISFTWVAKEHFCRCHRIVSAKQIRPRRTTGLQLGIQHASKKLGDYTSLLPYDDRQPL